VRPLNYAFLGKTRAFHYVSPDDREVAVNKGFRIQSSSPTMVLPCC
jgi:hypothetical protein